MKRKREDSDYKVHSVKHFNSYEKNGLLLIEIANSVARYLINKFSELYTFSNLFSIFNKLSKTPKSKDDPSFLIAHRTLALFTHFSPLNDNSVVMKFVQDAELSPEFLNEMRRINLGLEEKIPRSFLSFVKVLGSKMMREEIEQFYEKVKDHWRSKIIDTDDEFVNLISFIFSFKNGLFYPMSMTIDTLYASSHPTYKKIKELLLSNRNNLLTLFLLYLLFIIFKTEENKIQTYLCLSINFEGEPLIQELSHRIREKNGFREREDWEALSKVVPILLESLAKI